MDVSHSEGCGRASCLGQGRVGFVWGSALMAREWDCREARPSSVAGREEGES